MTKFSCNTLYISRGKTYLPLQNVWPHDFYLSRQSVTLVFAFEKKHPRHTLLLVKHFKMAVSKDL